MGKVLKDLCFLGCIAYFGYCLGKADAYYSVAKTVKHLAEQDTKNEIVVDTVDVLR